MADRLAEEFDDQWWEETADWWRETGERRAEEAIELEQLEQSAAGGMLDRDQQFRRAELTSLLRNDREALTIYRELLASDPEDADAAFFAGTILLAAGDREGLPLLEHLAEANVTYAPHCHAALARFHELNGDSEASGHWLAQLHASSEREALAEAEFRQIDAGTGIEPPTQSEAELEIIREALNGLGALKQAYLGSRTLEHGQRRQQIFIFEMRSGFDAQWVLDQIGSLLIAHGDYMGFSLAGDTRWLLKKLKRIPGTRLYPQ